MKFIANFLIHEIYRLKIRMSVKESSKRRDLHFMMLFKL